MEDSLGARHKFARTASHPEQPQHGYGRAVIYGLDHLKGDAAVILMADESDDCRDVVRYWQKLNEGYDCVFGSRFMKGAGVIDCPRLKLVVNRLANFFLRVLFNIKLNDTKMHLRLIENPSLKGAVP